ncbi:MAG: PD40 domain-containing protein [Deltaproteobacteria bacterium]|nr:PD40 domain-containing protein [Deltaproteobacteria bacterium]
MESRRKILIIICLLAGLMILSATAQARVYIDINQPFARKIPIAIPDFVPLDREGPSPKEISRDLARTMAENLDLSGLFILLDKRIFLEGDKYAGILKTEIKFKDWLMIGSELLVKGAFELKGDELVLELRLFDVFEGRLLIGKRYASVVQDGVAMVNRFINDILLVLTGETGVYGSLIAFVGKKDGNKEIYFTRFGWKDIFEVTANRSINLSPVFSRKGDEVAYISYKSGRPQLYIRNLFENREEKVTNGKSLYLSPAFTSGGGLLAAISRQNQSNVYLLERNGVIKRQLTHRWGINISPTISPDGKQVAFVSDRAGSPQIYIIPFAGGESTRLTFEGDYNTDPQWSPRGDRIVFVGMAGDQFNIYTINPDGSDRQQLTSDEADDTNPTWSPDGRMIVFASTRLGPSKLFTMTANGERQRPLALNFQGEQTSPAWAPVRLD